MPSHSPYALSNLTFLGSRKLHKNKRVFEIEVLPKIFLFRKNLSTRFCKLSLTGFDTLYLFPLISLIYHLFDVTLFSFQGTTFLNMMSLRTGGDEENRTPDPLLARQVLSQLSYTPV